MNVDATQLLDNAENTCVPGTLILKEVNRDVLKSEEHANTESINQNASVADKKNILSEISNYCLKLMEPTRYDQAENFIMPLLIGINKVGRSNTSDICIVDSNVSKIHANIELKVTETGQLDECFIQDKGSLNKMTLNTKRVLEKNETCQLQLDDRVLFGNICFKFVKMTENERLQQKLQPTTLLDLLTKKSSKKLNGQNGTNKSNNLFEIQNTLDDTTLIENNVELESSLKENNEDCDDKIYIADTDPEDETDMSNLEMSASIHLEMSQSINHSSYSINKSKTSFYIPDTMEQSYTDVQDAKEEVSDEIISEKMLPPRVPASKPIKTAVKNYCPETVLLENGKVADTVDLKSEIDSESIKSEHVKAVENGIHRPSEDVETDNNKIISDSSKIETSEDIITNQEEGEKIIVVVECEASETIENVKSQTSVLSENDVIEETPRSSQNDDENEKLIVESNDKHAIITPEALVESTETVEKPEATMESEIVENPETIEESKDDKKPETAEKPEATMESEIVEKPETIEESKDDKKPETAQKPDAINESEATEEFETASVPQTTEKSEVVKELRTAEKIEVIETTEKPESVLINEQGTRQESETTQIEASVKNSEVIKLPEPVSESSNQPTDTEANKIVENTESPDEETIKSSPVFIKPSSVGLKNDMPISNKKMRDEIFVESTLMDNSQMRCADVSVCSQQLNLDDYLDEDDETRGEEEAVKKPKTDKAVTEKVEDVPRATRRSTRSAVQPKEVSAKPAKKETQKKTALEKVEVDQETPVEENENEQKTSDSTSCQEPVKTVGRRGRRKTNTASNENTDETEQADEPEVAEVEKKEPLKRGRRKTVAVAPEVTPEKAESPLSENKSVEEPEEATEKNASEPLVKKEAPIKRGRRKTGTVAVVETEEKQQDSATSEAHSLENIEETGESVEKKPQASKRGRRKAVVVNSEDVSTAIEAVGATARNESESTAEVVTAEEPAKPTLGRRASLRTRPAVVSTPKEVPMKKTRQVKTIEEDPVKTPVKAKVTRRNSVAVPKSKPTTSNTELADENAAVEEETEATELKEAKKPPKSRRQTIAVASADIATPTAKVRRSAKSAKATASKNIDTYSYNEESDKSVHEEGNKKTLKKKRNQDDIATATTALENENEKKKLKSKANKAQLTESESEHEKSLTGKKKRAQKRKSDVPSGPLQAVSVQEVNENLGSTSTPKLFFHSKRVKTTSPTNKLAGNSSKTVYSPFLNTPTKVSHLNTSEIEASTNTGTPNSKKFRLLKDLKSSSSSESDDDNSENRLKSDVKTILSPLKSSLAASPTEASSKKTSNSAKHVSIKLPNKIESSKTNGNSSALNKTTDNIENQPERPAKVKSTRTSLGNIRGSNSSPKIMTTGIMLTDKEKQIVKNLGGEIVTDVRECTHLITNKIRKTLKFLSCLGRSVFIIGDRWLEESNKAKMFLSPITYTLNDQHTEKQYKFSLQTSLLKSKHNPLLQGWTFMLKYEDSPNEELTYSNIKTIIECAGGVVDESGKLPEESADLEKYCIIYESKEKFNSDKKNASLEVSKILLDNLLTCILRQSFDNSSMIENSSA